VPPSQPLATPVVVVPREPIAKEAPVRVTALGLSDRAVVADVRRLPGVGATLVAVREPGQEPFPTIAGSEREEDAGERAKPDPDAEPGADDFYAQLLVGLERSWVPDNSRTLLGRDLGILPLRELELWGNAEHGGFLRRVFDLETLVALEGVSIPASFDAITGERRYAVSVAAQSTTGIEGEHSIDVRISRKRVSRGAVLQASLLTMDEDAVVLAVPDPLLTGDEPARGWPGDMVFVAVAPRFRSPTLRRMLTQSREGPKESPILVDGPQDDLRQLAQEQSPGLVGKIVLAALIRDDGTVATLRLIEDKTTPNTTHLHRIAIETVRQWRYLPPRRDGRPFPTWTWIELDFPDDRR
jgi:hypothetical protein